ALSEMIILCTSIFSFFCLSWDATRRTLHSFPTRRSSDLAEHALDGADGHLFGVGAEDGFDGFGFDGVVFARAGAVGGDVVDVSGDRKSTRLNSSHVKISYAVFCLKKKRVRTSQT